MLYNVGKLMIIWNIVLAINGQATYFGPSSQYVCHCDGTCDTNTGACSRGCEQGWMGPSCQYVNLANRQDAFVSDSIQTKTWIVDGRYTTCVYTGYGTTPWAKIDMDPPTWITWIHVVTHSYDLYKLQHIVVTLTMSGAATNCTSSHSRSNGSVHNIVCDEPILASTVEISFQLKQRSNIRVCEVLVSGGVNVAVKHPASQSSDYNDSRLSYPASLAVDGIISQDFRDASCSHTGIVCSNVYYWNLNLENTYNIHMVRIYNRDRNQGELARFSLITKTRQGAWNTVYTDARQGGPGSIIPITLNPATQTDEIAITIPRCSGNLCLCEVQVFSAAPCSGYKFGFDCSGTCKCKNQSESCEMVSGSCSSGCAPGYTGFGCQNGCLKGRYGDGCNATCNNCLDTDCNPIDGTCNLGCGPGWLPDNNKFCNGVCPNGTFGPGCNFTCRCMKDAEVCNKVTGSCTSGCAAGFKQPNCQQKCSAGTYGINCQSQCSRRCVDVECDHVTGTCYKGCEAGYTGDMCKTRCTKDFYGVNCSETCSENCKYNYGGRLCTLDTGKCRRAGCQRGWTSLTCKAKCSPGQYGDRCSSTCSRACRDMICHHVNGSCTSGCVEGRQGESCQEACAEGTHGPDCRYNCSEGCKTVLCDPVTGDCRDGCGPGWRGDDCSLACPSDKYGDGCLSECSSSCNDSVCGNVNGACIQGCIAGYKGEYCTQKCDSGTHSANCESTCSEGCEEGQCNSTDGSCTCKEGWRGQNCDFTCEAGYYGQGCMKQCSTNCQDSDCDGIQGMCFSCQSGWSGNLCQVPETAGVSSGLISGIAVGCILILALAVIIAVFIIRRKIPRKSAAAIVRYDNTATASAKKVTIERTGTPKDKTDDSQSTKLLAASKSELNNGDAGEVYYNIATSCSSSTVVTVIDFPQYVNKWRLNKQHLYEEFQKLPKDLINDSNVAFASHNTKKNRYKNICAYDHSRVVLTSDPDHPDIGDYINACYIHTPNKQNAFIASQGPNDVIINDFVRMLWELNIQKVVMLTNLFEEGKQKCHQYWPDTGEESTFGDIFISVQETTVHADYSIRRLTLKRKGEGSRKVTQYHFTSWPDKGVPRSAASLLDFRDKVMTSPLTNKKPVVVHCSAGIGRTGTFIALQYLKEEAEISATQDIYTCVWSLRQQRVNMVQTKDQYVFLHEASLVSLLTSPSSLSLTQFRQQYEHLHGDATRLQGEFQTLQEFPVRVDEEEFSTAIKEENKNRHRTILAGNSTRPVLMPNQDYEETSGTYINAVFLPSYDGPRKFIQTQSPLPNTVVDIWRMVADFDVAMIFMLDNYTQDDEDVAVYWPDVRSPLEIGCYRVECLTMSQNDEVIVRNIELKQDKSSKRLVHITAKFWNNDDVPSIPSLLQLLHMSNSKQNPRSSIIVHCRSGATKSGLFCAVAAIVDRINVDKTVAVPVVVGNIKAIRRQNIPNISQYKYCYEAAAEYVGPEPVYSNTEAAASDGTAEGEATVYSSIDEEHIYSNQ